MGRLQTWGAAARRSPVLLGGWRPWWWWPWSAGGVVLATRSSPPPAPTPSPSTRAVALGDSVPYGHGLANPYLTPQQGLPADAGLPGPLDARPTRAWSPRPWGSP